MEAIDAYAEHVKRLREKAAAEEAEALSGRIADDLSGSIADEECHPVLTRQEVVGLLEVIRRHINEYSANSQGLLSRAAEHLANSID